MKSRKKKPQKPVVAKKPDLKRGTSPIHPEWHEALARRLAEGLEAGLAFLASRPPAEDNQQFAHKLSVKEAAEECKTLIDEHKQLSDRIAYLSAVEDTPRQPNSAPREAHAHIPSRTEKDVEKEEAVKLCRKILNNPDESVDNRMKSLDRLAKLREWFDEKDDEEDIDPAKYAAYVNRERLRRFGGTASVKAGV